MTEITIEELIEKAKERKIDLGSDPKKVIRFYTGLGLIPKPKRRRVKGNRGKTTRLFYPESALDKLAQIKALKSEGLSLDEIRDSFALEYVRDALRDLLSKADDEKVKRLASIIGTKEELEAIVEAPLIYIIEGMSQEEVKRLLTLFCGVGFYALLEAQEALEGFRVNEARRALFKSIFYNSIAMLRLARTTGDTKLESTASEIYENMVLAPIRRASERVRREFIKSVEAHLREREVKKTR
ncbi:MAG TPA: MerR family transcriptional regulator [Thermodesulfobacteriota bacterium]|jgi:DNA-binding transcriptional MerR regulator|nr:MerR family transcriptional regulator [Thermodesulfobacteriota bacterium]